MTEPQIESTHYWSADYNTKERFASFWHQIDETLRLEPATVLEVGPGNGIVTWALRKAGVEVTTLDIDESVQPDVVGTVTDIRLPDRSIDVVLASEVLEHLPFEDSERALAEMRRVARTGAVLSVPDVTPYAGVSYPLYFGMYADRIRQTLPPTRRGLLAAMAARRIRVRDFLWARLVPARWSLGGRVARPRLPIPHRAWRHEFDGQHYWELGTEGFPPERMTAAVERAGFALEKDFRVPELPWHHFYVAR